MKTININGEKVMEFENKEIYFAYHHDFVEMNNALFCISLKDTSRKNRYYIIADNNFMKLSNTAKKFLAFHEMGHIANGDLEEKNFLKCAIMSFIRRFFGISNKMEFKADLHAVRYVGKIAALNSMHELIALKGEQLSVLEMEERVKRIEEGKC